jgi:hypothetical protein
LPFEVDQARCAAGSGGGAGSLAAATGGDKENFRAQPGAHGDPEGIWASNAGAREVLTIEGKRKRKAEGSSTKASEMRDAKDEIAFDRLWQIVPAAAKAHMAGFSEQRAQRKAAGELRELAMVKMKAGRWTSAAMHEAANALTALYADLQEQNVEFDPMAIEPGEVTAHLARFVKQQEAKKKARGSLAGANGHAVLRAINVEGPQRVGKKEQTLWSSGLNRKRGLSFCQNKCHIQLGMDEVEVISIAGTFRGTSTPSATFTLGILCRLEACCADPTTPPTLAHFAAGMLFCTFACMRFAQAQMCWITGIIDDEIIAGFVYREKDHDPKKMQPRPRARAPRPSVCVFRDKDDGGGKDRPPRTLAVRGRPGPMLQQTGADSESSKKGPWGNGTGAEMRTVGQKLYITW